MARNLRHIKCVRNVKDIQRVIGPLRRGLNVPVVLVHSVSRSVIAPGGPLQFHSALGSLCVSNRWPAVHCCVLTPQGC